MDARKFEGSRRLLLALFVTVAVLPPSLLGGVVSAEEMVIETDKTYTKGTYNGQAGYWVEFSRKKYQKNLNAIYDPIGPWDGKIQEAFVASLGLNRALDRATREAIYQAYGLPRNMSQGYDGAYHDINWASILEQLKTDINRGRWKATNASTDDIALMSKLANAADTSALVDAIGPAELNADIVKAFSENMKEGQRQGAWWGAAGYGGGEYIYTASDGAHTIGYTHGIEWKAPDFDQATFDRNRGKSIQNVLLNNPADFKKLTSVGYIDAVAQAGRFLKMAELIEKGVNPAGLKVDSLVNTTNGPVRITEGQPTPARLRELSRWLISTSWTTHSPIALDLNHDGKIGVTGLSTAQHRMQGNKFQEKGAVLFDITASGTRKKIEWLDDSGDGFLVDDSFGAVSQVAAKDGVIDAKVLFGNAVGYANGYHKLAYKATKLQLAASPKFDAATNWTALYNKKPTLAGKTLESLKVWVDANHDAMVQPAELKTLASLGITEIGSRPEIKKNEHGEYVIQSYFVQNSRRQMTEDVWFAEEPAATAAK
ncbi:MAG: hypothetical protein FJZ01_09055 [Candidatus Sericytochromatia bacterium]|nr:hypothetical protein [Candidatus Tanganyikabacteria bacterium]